MTMSAIIDSLPGRRAINVLGVVLCAGLMGAALYFQHGMGLDPCPLCVFQRLGVIAIGVVALLAALHHPSGWGRRVYAGLAALTGAAGAGVAGWHVHLQNLPEDEVPECGPGLDYMLDVFPFMDMLKAVFQGSGECAEISWSFLGLSMPMWVLLWCVGLGIGGFLNNWRR